MVRAMVLATVLLFVPRAISAQPLSVLHIKVVLLDAEGKPAPVPRHALLISDNPATAAPRLVTTTLDGTADVKLRPGNYTVESDRPVLFHGKGYQWTQVVDIVAGRDAVLELTAANAEIVSPPPTTASGTPLEADPSFVLPQWQDSVVALWTPFTRASAFVIDSRGLVATNQRIVGTVTSVEVQLTPTTKVVGSVVAADRIADVAVVRVDPKAIASIKPLPLGCSSTTVPPAAAGDEIFTIAVPLREPKGVISGKISRVEPGAVLADFLLDPAGAGGPVFTGSGNVIGITSLIGEEDENRRGDVKIVPVANACAVVATAEKKMAGAAPPSGALLPVDPPRAFPVDALKAIVEKRIGSLGPYQIASSEFDVAFITPVHMYGVQYQAEQARERERKKASRTPEPQQAFTNRLMDFANWSTYVEDFPPVLLVRVTPKMGESFWTTVARGAARTQGMAIPPIKRFKYSFERLRAFCGSAEVAPIHPFKIEQHVSETSTMYEGLYVFDPATLGPQCGTVKLVMYSDKEPTKEDATIVDPKVVRQIWQDFEPYRTATR